MDGPTPNTPATQQAAPPANPVPADAEAIKAAVLQEVFGGKYQTVEDAKKGHWELNNYASQAYQALQERVNPATVQAQRPDPFQRLQDEAMVPKDAFQEAVRQLVKEELRPIGQAMEARNQIV